MACSFQGFAKPSLQLKPAVACSYANMHDQHPLKCSESLRGFYPSLIVYKRCYLFEAFLGYSLDEANTVSPPFVAERGGSLRENEGIPAGVRRTPKTRAAAV
jgi:hypothetical protein